MTISARQSKGKKRELKSNQAMEREKKIFLAVTAVCVATLIIHVIIQIGYAVKASGAREQRLVTLKSQRIIELAEDEGKFAQELEIAKKAREEDIAAVQRAEELRRRRELDQGYAVSDREKQMLMMKAIGENPDITPAEALTKIAKLASPAKSGVGVYEEKHGFRIEVAFPFKEVTESHPELKNYLPGFYVEVKRTAASIMKDIMAFGRQRGISEVSVICQDLVTIKSRNGNKRERRSLFIVTGAPGNYDWQRMTRSEVERVWKKKRDQFPGMLRGH